MTYVILEPCSGPPCPRCGCRDCKILQAPAAAAENQQFFIGGNTEHTAKWNQSPWWGSGKARCNHCGTHFSFRDDEPGADAAHEDECDSGDPPTKCPACGGGKYYVYSSKVKKYRKCRDCGFSIRKETQKV